MMQHLLIGYLDSHSLNNNLNNNVKLYLIALLACHLKVNLESLKGKDKEKALLFLNLKRAKRS
jgi:hypothetical protein